MKIYLHNTLTRQKEEFVPIDARNVRLYACGPTVYNHAHIGNARPAVVFDLLARVLRHVYGDAHVTYTRNITDIDDKIMQAAAETGEEISVITEKYTRIYNEDMGALGVGVPDHQPRATAYVPEMLEMIEKLIAAGHAYADAGHVLFNVPSWTEYGALSRLRRDDLIAGARVDVAPYKKDPADFVLWKPSSAQQPGWDSPWGRGRPGWHLECSAMNAGINGVHFDIHAGGEDLIFPHHENEIAQSTCAHGGEKYVNYWVHNGHLMVEGQKMSKSLGNYLLVHDLIREYPPEALRLVLLSAHYRQPIDFTKAGIEQAKKTLDRYYGLLRDAADVPDVDADVPEGFAAALADDLNTPRAMAELAQIAKGFAADKQAAKAALKSAGKLLGILQQDPQAWFQSAQAAGAVDAAEIDALIVARRDARAQKNFAESDRIRDVLAAQGIIIEDSPQGTTWRRQ